MTKRKTTASKKKQQSQPRVSNNNSREVERLRQQVANLKAKSQLTPLGQVALQAGNAIGSMFGFNKIFGKGAYRMQQNSMWNVAEQVPFMHSSAEGVRIRHREYVKDITTSTTFTTELFNVNPGLASLFPYLSNIANSFQEYRFHGLIFEFKSTASQAIGTSTNLALGTVSMVAQYRADAPAPTTKQDLLNDMWSVDGRPSENIILPVECAPRENPMAVQYIRGQGEVAPGDIKMYDLCNFVLATTGSQAPYTAGELWISYDVEFYKPKLNATYVPGNLFLARIRGTGGVPATVPIFSGITQVNTYNPTGITIGTSGGVGISFPAGLVGKFMITIELELAAAGDATGATSFSTSNVSPLGFFNNGASFAITSECDNYFNRIWCATIEKTDMFNSGSLIISGNLTTTQNYSYDIIITPIDP